MKPRFILDESIFLDRLFDEYRDNQALVMPSGIYTFREIRERLRIVISNLQQAGVREGDHVALHAENSELHLYLFLAAWVIGFLYIPLDFKAPLESLLEIIPVDFLVKAGNDASAVNITILKLDELLRGSLPVTKTLSLPAIPFSREASVIFTSGSTGKPRGIVHTVGNYIYSALGTNACIGLKPTDRWLLSLPLFHVGGILILVRTLLSGSSCILPESTKNIDKAILTYHPSVISLVPTQLIRLLENEAVVKVLQKAKSIMLGGAPSPAWLIEKVLDLGIPFMPTYGATEACAQVTGVAKGADRKSYFTSGRPVAYREVKIRDDKTIMLGGKTLFKRYLDDSPYLPVMEGRFFKTADAGYIDPEGNLVVLGRKDLVFISGGENIQPFEIENALLSMDHIITAIVVPVPHREFGMVPWAFVEMSGSFDEAAIITELKSHLPGYKVPKRIILLDTGNRKEKMKQSRETLAKMAKVLAGKEKEYAR